MRQAPHHSTAARLSSCFCLTLSLLALAACASHPRPPAEIGSSYQVGGQRYHPLASSTGFVQQGLASWYGRDFHQRRTANGERYNMYDRTAAHKILPFNTYVLVTNLKNGRKTVVRINDRGPFVKGRIIDLTYTAARDLAMVEDGVAPVRLEALGYARKSYKDGKWVRHYVKPSSYTVGDFAIQVGAFTRQANALRLRASLRRRYRNVSVTTFAYDNQKFYRVRVGSYSRLEQARAAATRLQKLGFANAFVVARDK